MGTVGDNTKQRRCAALHLEQIFTARSVDGVFLIAPSLQQLKALLFNSLGDTLSYQFAAVCGVGVWRCEKSDCLGRGIDCPDILRPGELLDDPVQDISQCDIVAGDAERMVVFEVLGVSSAVVLVVGEAERSIRDEVGKKA